MSVSRQPPTERDLELLSAYLDGELTDRESRSLEQRLATNASLRAELDALRQTVVMLSELPPLKAPRNFTLDPAQFTRPLPWWRRWFSLDMTLQFAGALGTAASIVLIAVALVSGLGSDDTDTASQRQQANDEIAAYPTDTMRAQAFNRTATQLWATQNAQALRLSQLPGTQTPGQTTFVITPEATVVTLLETMGDNAAPELDAADQAEASDDDFSMFADEEAAPNEFDPAADQLFGTTPMPTPSPELNAMEQGFADEAPSQPAMPPAEMPGPMNAASPESGGDFGQAPSVAQSGAADSQDIEGVFTDADTANGTDEFGADADMVEDAEAESESRDMARDDEGLAGEAARSETEPSTGSSRTESPREDAGSKLDAGWLLGLGLGLLVFSLAAWFSGRRRARA